MGKKLTAGSDWEKIFAEYKPNMVSYLEDTGKERKKKRKSNWRKREQQIQTTVTTKSRQFKQKNPEG